MDNVKGNNIKRLEALVQLALSRAAGAYRAIVALANNAASMNAGGALVGNVVTWSSAPITSKASGKYLVIAGLSGLVDAVDILTTSQLQKTVTPLVGPPVTTAIGPTWLQTAGHVTADFAVYAAWIDNSGVTPATGGTVTYKIVLTGSGGHSVTIAIDQALILYVELPT